MVESVGRRIQRKQHKARCYLPRLERLEERALMAAGDLDLSFSGDGKLAIDFGVAEEGSSSALQRDGKILMLGVQFTPEVYPKDWLITRVRSDGVLDPGFGVGGRAVVPFDLPGDSKSDVARGIAVQRDGKIVVAGWATGVDLTTFMAVARLESNGVLDSSFGDGGKLVISFNQAGFQDDKAYGVALQRDGKILVVGASLNVNQDHDYAVARLLTDGSFDPTFGVNGRALIAFDVNEYKDDNAYALTVQRDGKIVVAGTARVAVNDIDIAVARLLPNGALDPQFGDEGKVRIGYDTGSVTTADSANVIAVRADGKIVIAGSTRLSTNNNADMAAVRLAPNGVLDSSFGDGGKIAIPFDIGDDLGDRALGMALQPDDKMVMAGPVKTGFNQYTFGVVRITASGALDRTFSGDGKTTVSVEAPNNINFDFATSLLRQPDGKIIVGGFSFKTPDTDGSDFSLIRLLGDDGRTAPPSGSAPFAELSERSEMTTDRAESTPVRVPQSTSDTAFLPNDAETPLFSSSLERKETHSGLDGVKDDLIESLRPF